jgi:hypothetical protein
MKYFPYDFQRYNALEFTFMKSSHYAATTYKLFGSNLEYHMLEKKAFMIIYFEQEEGDPAQAVRIQIHETDRKEANRLPTPKEYGGTSNETSVSITECRFDDVCWHHSFRSSYPL